MRNITRQQALPLLVSLGKRIDIASENYVQTGDIEYKHLYDRLVKKMEIIKQDVINLERE